MATVKSIQEAASPLKFHYKGMTCGLTTADNKYVIGWQLFGKVDSENLPDDILHIAKQLSAAYEAMGQQRFLEVVDKSTPKMELPEPEFKFTESGYRFNYEFSIVPREIKGVR